MHFNGLHRAPRSLRAAGIAGLTALTLTLAACGGGSGSDSSPSPSSAEPSVSASATETPSPTPTVEPTLLSDLEAMTVSGDMAAAPEVSAPYPFKVDTTMNKVIVAGTGPVVPTEQSSVEVQYLGINARTGESFDSSWSRGSSIAFSLTQLIPGFAKGVVGQPVGSRVAIAITSSDGYDPSGQPSIGIEPGDTLIFIVDILDAELAGPSGEPVAIPDGMPQVTDNAGVPAISIPAGTPEPTAVSVVPVIQGSGRALGAADALTSHAVCTTWDGTEYYNDYAEAPVADAASGGSVHQALFSALVGQQTGSRVLVTMPGSVAYPNGNREPSIAPNTSIACVVDILFTQTY